MDDGRGGTGGIDGAGAGGGGGFPVPARVGLMNLTLRSEGVRGREMDGDRDRRGSEETE